MGTAKLEYSGEQGEKTTEYKGWTSSMDETGTRTGNRRG